MKYSNADQRGALNMHYSNKAEVNVKDLGEAMQIFNLARTAKSEVAVEKGQWRVVVVSPLGFFGLCSLKTKEPMVIMSEDADFIEKVKRV